MIRRLERLGELREILLRLEGDLGMDGLSRFERDLLHAVRMLAGTGQSVVTGDLRAHPLVADMTQPTFHRALRALVDQGLLARAPGERARYVLGAQAGGACPRSQSSATQTCRA